MSSTKKKFSSKEIIDKINVLRNRYVHYTGSTLNPVEFSKDSNIPFWEISKMIMNCEDLEKPYMPNDKIYVFSFFVNKYFTDLNFLVRNVLPYKKITEKDIVRFRTAYEKVIIECIREYLTNKKYTSNNTHFYDTVQELCNKSSNAIKNIINFLTHLKDPLLENPEFLSLCDKIIPTDAQYAGPPVAIRTRHTNRSTSSSVSATEAPRDLTPPKAEEEPLYIDPRTGRPVYHIPMTWLEDPSNRLTKRSRSRSRPRSRSGSRGGKRKTKKQYRKKC